MSRVDELKQKVSDAEARFQSLRDSKQALKRKLRESKVPITLAWAEIETAKSELKAALEAQERKPREVTIFVCDDRYSFMSADGWRKATFREVKPIVVTRENAERFFSYLNSFDITRQEKLVGSLNYIGIDAEPSND